MTLTEILVVKLGTRLGKILLKSYLRDPAEAIGEDLLDVAKGRIESYVDRREAKRQFERIGERIAEQLEPLFVHEFQRDQVSVEAVISQLSEALDGRISAEFFLERDLDSAKLQAELKRLHPLPGGQFSSAEEELYDHALREIVRYVVEIAAKLPRFEVTQAKESLQRLSRLEDVVGETAKDVKHIKDWVSLQETDQENRQYEIEYRLAIIRNLDYLELFGADLTPESRRQALSVAYISLNLDMTSAQAEAGPTPAETALAALSGKSNLLLIRGEAGSGKSTLFRWAAIEAARGAGESISPRSYQNPGLPPGGLLGDELSESIGQPQWRQSVPFLLRLRDCKDGRLPPPEDFPALMAKEIGNPPAAWVRAVLRGGRGLLLFDGIDEVPILHRETVKQEIRAIVGAYPKNLFLVSTRPAAVPEDWLRDVGFPEARVNPMSEVDRSRFVDKWHEAVGLELARMGRPTEDLPGLAQELKRQLPENPEIARLATNPLLCAMICALHKDRGQQLPDSQSELCEALCQVLLQRRELESGLNLEEFPESYRRLTYPQKKAIAEEIATYMILNYESSLPLGQAIEKVADSLKALAGQATENAPIICRELVERSGILREVKPGHIDFIHNAFKEYLAGNRFAIAGHAGLLAERALDPTWRQVVRFAVATQRKGFADEVIQKLLSVKFAFAKERRARQIMALQCRAAALFVSPAVEAKLDGIVQAIFPPKSMEDAEALADLGDVAVPFLVNRPELKPVEAAACVRALRLIGTQSSHLLLEGYFEDTRSEVVGELAQAVNPLVLKGVQEMLLAGEDLTDGILSQIIDLSPLAALTTLQRLDLTGTPVTDVSSLSGLSNLQRLSLSGTLVSDVSALSGLSNLQWLNLSGTRVSNVSALSGLSNLQWLDLSGTAVSDVSALSRLKKLEITR
ncbi:MAG TPA: leucine-rich repeat domain-containing protein [Thermoanaerobaculia bacterium]|nr:leucine-rich repeat domain-containing protein [Thermoanaerobaculia bacterium]